MMAQFVKGNGYGVKRLTTSDLDNLYQYINYYILHWICDDLKIHCKR